MTADAVTMLFVANDAVVAVPSNVPCKEPVADKECMSAILSKLP